MVDIDSKIGVEFQGHLFLQVRKTYSFYDVRIRIKAKAFFSDRVDFYFKFQTIFRLWSFFAKIFTAICKLLSAEIFVAMHNTFCWNICDNMQNNLQLEYLSKGQTFDRICFCNNFDRSWQYLLLRCAISWILSCMYLYLY